MTDDRTTISVDPETRDRLDARKQEDDRYFMEQESFDHVIRRLLDRTDHSTDPADRLLARERMVGDRDDLASTSDPPYPGIAGEVQYILESVRRGLDEWDRVEYDPIDFNLGNSNADVRWSVDLIRLAVNAV